ncbi:MAG: 4Fe-4S dicluster domain-containing protein, partial [Acidimicrobiales bacterium]
MTQGRSWLAPDDPAAAAGWTGAGERMGFFTDTSVCIGCTACEVACKEWNQVPEDGLNLLGHSYDNTGALGADSWRHVAFIEQRVPPAGPDGSRLPAPWTGWAGDGEEPARVAGGPQAPAGVPGVRWLMSSDVCKHCTSAACLEVCPTGALFRTEYGTVVVQEDVCNGCGY